MIESYRLSHFASQMGFKAEDILRATNKFNTTLNLEFARSEVVKIIEAHRQMEGIVRDYWQDILKLYELSLEENKRLKSNVTNGAKISNDNI